MSITRILNQIDQGDPQAPGALLTLVYSELRRLAEFKMRREGPGQTLQPTALVHEAFLRLLPDARERKFHNRSHFFAAAAEAMRRILIENARRRRSDKHGGKFQRHELDEQDATIDSVDADTLLDLDQALQKLADQEPELAKLVELRYFAGLTIDEAAEVLEVSPRTVKRNWAYARAWLGREMHQDEPE